ncbi:MAG TPA: thiamine pyrophosphate-binding protein [bacterium]|nr:thiamine pyrophosphate-binding protein [bacterium]
MNGARALLTMLRSAGVDRLFGNPGTTEVPLLDELASFDGITYHLVLQEGVAVGMADGYAQAAGRVGVLSLHVTGGVANALGLLYNASRAGTPLLVLSGQQDTRLALQEPFLYSDMVRWVRPLVKWAHEVAHPSDLPRALRRALREAVAPPSGPVFLAVPLDVLRAQDVPVEDLGPPATPRTGADPAAVSAAADLLRRARAPLIVAGDRVAHAGAEATLLALAEATGWPVALEPYPTRFVFPSPHAQARSPLPRFAAGVRAALEAHDVVLVIGLTPFEHFLYDGASPLPPGTRVIHFDLAPAFIARNHPVAVGVCGDLPGALASLRENLGRASRGDLPGATIGGGPRPSGPTPFDDPYAPVADVIAGVVEPHDILVEEAISARAAILGRVPRSVPGTLFGEKGGTIGWGFPAALGVGLARPGTGVFAVVGDGSFLMEVQGLWTAARDGIAIVLIVLNNRGYAILKQGLASLGGEAARRGVYPGTDVPGVDLLGLARSFGVAGERVAAAPGRPWASELRQVLRRARNAGGPVLVEVVLDVPVRPLA